MSPQNDPILVAIARLEVKVDTLAKKVADHEGRLRWVASAAILIVGLIGGPNAAQIITTGTGG